MNTLSSDVPIDSRHTLSSKFEEGGSGIITGHFHGWIAASNPLSEPGREAARKQGRSCRSFHPAN